MAAVSVLQSFLSSSRGMEALDRLTAIAVDPTRTRALRLATIRALRGLGPSTVASAAAGARQGSGPAIALAAGLGPEAATDPVYLLKEAADGTLPDSPRRSAWR